MGIITSKDIEEADYEVVSESTVSAVTVTKPTALNEHVDRNISHFMRVGYAKFFKSKLDKGAQEYILSMVAEKTHVDALLIQRQGQQDIKTLETQGETNLQILAIQGKVQVEAMKAHAKLEIENVTEHAKAEMTKYKTKSAAVLVNTLQELKNNFEKNMFAKLTDFLEFHDSQLKAAEKLAEKSRASFLKHLDRRFEVMEQDFYNAFEDFGKASNKAMSAYHKKIKI